MSNRTRSAKSKQKRKELHPDQFHVDRICYDSTCVTLDLPLSLCCHVCSRQKDIFNKKSSQPDKKQKYLHESNRCHQLWDSSWATKDKVTSGILLQHNRVRNYLGIEPSVLINFKCVYDNNNHHFNLNKQAINTSQVHNEFSAQKRLLDQISTSEPLPSNNQQQQYQQHANPPSGNEKSESAPSTFPPSVDAAMSLLTEADKRYIESSSTLSQCIQTLQNLVSSTDTNPTQPCFFPHIISPSKLYETVSKTKLARLEKKAEFFDQVNLKIKRRRSYMSNLSRRLYGVMMMMAPKLSLEIAQSICALAIAAYMNDCGFDIDNIGNSTPSASTLKKIMVQEAIETVLLEKEQMTDKKLTILCDKGEGMSSRDGAAFVKLIARYDSARDRVRTTAIGIQSAGNSSEDGALGIHEALKLFDYPDKPLKVSATGTDAGGGATREHLGTKLALKGKVKNIAELVSTTCSLHAMNLTLQSPTALTMGEGGLHKRTALQLLHTAYNLSQQFQTAEWAELWMKVTTTQWEQIKCPIMTRWEYVCEATAHLLRYRNEWLTMAKVIVSYNNTGTAKHTIGSYLFSLIQEPMLIAHVQFLHAYIVSWWDKHFQWLKHVDDETKTPGFLAVHMPLRYFVQSVDLDELTLCWNEREEFTDFVSCFPQESEYKKEELATMFFGRVKNRFHKHFCQWRDKYLFFMLGGEHEPAMFLARWLLGQDLPPIPATFQSKKHHREINLHHMISFLTKDKSPTDYHSKDFFQKHLPAIKELTQGKAIREINASESRNFFLNM